MSLFHKRIYTDLDTVIYKCKKLSKSLMEHYRIRFDDHKEEWDHRLKTFDENSISEYAADTYSNVPTQFITARLKYRINESVGPILSIQRMSDYNNSPFFIPVDPYRFTGDPDVIYIKVLDETDQDTHSNIKVTAVIPTSKFIKKYHNLKIGDMIEIDGPIAVSQSHNDKDPDYGFFMRFDIYVSL